MRGPPCRRCPGFKTLEPEKVREAIALLQLEQDDTVLDLFSGLGNFTLPIATQCAHVTGVEGSLAMVNKARMNAELNDITNARFHYVYLYSD